MTWIVALYRSSRKRPLKSRQPWVLWKVCCFFALSREPLTTSSTASSDFLDYRQPWASQNRFCFWAKRRCITLVCLIHVRRSSGERVRRVDDSSREPEIFERESSRLGIQKSWCEKMVAPTIFGLCSTPVPSLSVFQRESPARNMWCVSWLMFIMGVDRERFPRRRSSWERRERERERSDRRERARVERLFQREREYRDERAERESLRDERERWEQRERPNTEKSELRENITVWY